MLDRGSLTTVVVLLALRLVAAWSRQPYQVMHRDRERVFALPSL